MAKERKYHTPVTRQFVLDALEYRKVQEVAREAGHPAAEYVRAGVQLVLERLRQGKPIWDRYGEIVYDYELKDE